MLKENCYITVYYWYITFKMTYKLCNHFFLLERYQFCILFSSFETIFRYLAVLQPMRLYQMDRRGKLMIAVAWIASLICSLPQVNMSFLIILTLYITQTISFINEFVCFNNNWYQSLINFVRNSDFNDWKVLFEILIVRMK